MESVIKPQFRQGIDDNGVPLHEWGAAKLTNDESYLIRKGWFRCLFGESKFQTYFPPLEEYLNPDNTVNQVKLRKLTTKDAYKTPNYATWALHDLDYCPEFYSGRPKL